MLLLERPGRSVAFAATALLTAALAGCVGNPTFQEARSPWHKVERLLALDFSNQAAQRRRRGIERMLDLPQREMTRVPRLVTALDGAPERMTRRAAGLPGRISRVLGGEFDRAQKLPGHLPAMPDPDRIARTLARDVERAGHVLGLERRPLGEPSDPEHRTDPHDDRPVMSWWQRLRRRILP